MSFTHLYVAQVIFEAETPLSVGTGRRDVHTDQLVARDPNGLPYIPGATLAGLVRNALIALTDSNTVNTVFGFHDPDKSDNSLGSRIIFSSALMVGESEEVIDGIPEKDFKTNFFQRFLELPVRQHVSISSKGVAKKGATEQGGKFNNEVVYKGTRFCFEMELFTNNEKNDIEAWNTIILLTQTPGFRIGGGTRKGYGKIKIIGVKHQTLDLRLDLNKYLTKSSNLNDMFWKNINSVVPEAHANDQFIEYTLELVPDDFFIFGSGFESGDADMTFVTETEITWTDNKPVFEEKVIIPASSVKGAIAHRVAFHYNKGNNRREGTFADRTDNLESKENANVAVFELFGKIEQGCGSQRGKVLFSDIFLRHKFWKKLLNHVSVDPFTGGAIEGHLFSEEVVGDVNEPIILHISLDKSVKDPDIIWAFERALSDVCCGMLPLGGGTLRGHGIFMGKLFKNREEIFFNGNN